jgi:LDH2 family malate/lactate/ureidoglycolate dehydrogenase
LQALKRDLIGWAMTNSTKLVAPLWGAERMLGTNPIAVAFPGLDEPPIVIDMATSATAYGKIEIALRAGKPIPEQGQRTLNGCSSKDFQHEVLAPAAAIALHGHTLAALMLLQ